MEKKSKSFITYYRDRLGEVQELEISATSKSSAQKAARIHAKNYDLRFIGFPEDFGLKKTEHEKH